MFLWLWRRLVATGPIRPLAWEPPYATGEALEKAKRPKKKREREREKRKSHEVILHRHLNSSYSPREPWSHSVTGYATLVTFSVVCRSKVFTKVFVFFCLFLFLFLFFLSFFFF